MIAVELPFKQLGAKMNVSIWLVMGGELGTATMSKRGRVEDFRPAKITPSVKRLRPNLVTVLESGVEYGPLGEVLLSSVEGDHIGNFYMNAVPHRPLVFEKGVSSRPSYSARFNFATDTDSVGRHFTKKRLSLLNQNLKQLGFLDTIVGLDLGGYSVSEIGLGDLPGELELVVTRDCWYQHEGETFFAVNDLKVIGFHQRSVEMFERAILRKLFDEARGRFDNVLKEYERVSKERRDTLNYLRYVSIPDIKKRIQAAGSNRRELNEVIEWIGDRSTASEPRFLAEQLKALYDSYETSTIPGLREEFASLRSDLLDVVRDYVVEHLSQSV